MADIIAALLLFTHLLGFAGVAGGLLAQYSVSVQRPGPLILYGARWQLISGLLLVGIRHDELRPSVVITKLALAVAIAAITEQYAAKGVAFSRRAYQVLLILVLAVIACAIFIRK